MIQRGVLVIALFLSLAIPAMAWADDTFYAFTRYWPSDKPDGKGLDCPGYEEASPGVFRSLIVRQPDGKEITDADIRAFSFYRGSPVVYDLSRTAAPRKLEKPGQNDALLAATFSVAFPPAVGGKPVFDAAKLLGALCGWNGAGLPIHRMDRVLLPNTEEDRRLFNEFAVAFRAETYKANCHTQTFQNDDCRPYLTLRDAISETITPVSQAAEANAAANTATASTPTKAASTPVMAVSPPETTAPSAMEWSKPSQAPQSTQPNVEKAPDSNGLAFSLFALTTGLAALLLGGFAVWRTERRRDSPSDTDLGVLTLDTFAPDPRIASLQRDVGELREALNQRHNLDTGFRIEMRNALEMLEGKLKDLEHRSHVHQDRLNEALEAKADATVVRKALARMMEIDRYLRDTAAPSQKTPPPNEPAAPDPRKILATKLADLTGRPVDWPPGAAAWSLSILMRWIVADFLPERADPALYQALADWLESTRGSWRIIVPAVGDTVDPETTDAVEYGDTARGNMKRILGIIRPGLVENGTVVIKARVIIPL
jgi:hypothetical protein